MEHFHADWTFKPIVIGMHCSMYKHLLSASLYSLPISDDDVLTVRMFRSTILICLD